MSDSGRTFVDACLAGEALADDVDDWVQSWHDSDGAPDGVSMSLDSYLGFTSEEGDLWAERPESLRFVLAARQWGRPVAEILRGQDESSLAARAASPGSARRVLAWLHETGRLK